MSNDPFGSRRFTIRYVLLTVAAILLIRLFFLQVVDTTYAELASNNVLRKVTVYPARGLVYDRNGLLIVNNEAIYDIMVVPKQVGKMDTAKFCELLTIEIEQFKESLQAAKEYSRYKPSVFLKQLSSENYAVFQEHLYEFPGFYAQLRTMRRYPYKNAAHLLGYTGEVNPKQIQKQEYYKSGDYIGVSGIELSYEEDLRGKKGVKHLLVDVHNREQGSWRNGASDIRAEEGRSLQTSIDIALQAYGERLMENKTGSIVMIEPGTGEIITILGSPSYDPNLLTGRKRSENYNKLRTDSLKPLINRAMLGQYPPGSPFKPFMALIALQDGVINPNFSLNCSGAFVMKNLRVGCLAPGYFDLHSAIQNSCNTYFCTLYRKVIEQQKFKGTAEAFQSFRDYLLGFGYGQKLGVDLPSEIKGNLPTPDFYDKLYVKGRWYASTTISLGIGQGEFGFTPLQIANGIATIANKGYYIVPHVVKQINGKDSLDARFYEKHYAKVDPKHYDVIVDAMEDVVNKGTARIARLDGLAFCGKTGSAENPHGKDHSLFVGFAPKDDPKVVIVVVVETAGFGATYAAPIASLMVEKYLNDSIATSRKWLEERMMEANLLQ